MAHKQGQLRHFVLREGTIVNNKKLLTRNVAVPNFLKMPEKQRQIIQPKSGYRCKVIKTQKLLFEPDLFKKGAS